MHLNFDDHSDQDLLAAMSRGEKQVLNLLFNRYYAELVSYGIRYVRIGTISEEIVQEIFINFWERRGSLQITSSIKAYLSTAVRYRCINYLKHQLPKDQKTTDTDAIEDFAEDFSAIQESKELGERIRKAVDALPKKCRAIFILAKEEGYTYREIAETLDLSEKTVENQMGIALKKLRVALQQEKSSDTLHGASIIFIFEIIANSLGERGFIFDF